MELKQIHIWLEEENFRSCLVSYKLMLIVSSGNPFDLFTLPQCSGSVLSSLMDEQWTSFGTRPKIVVMIVTLTNQIINASATDQVQIMGRLGVEWSNE